MLLLLTLFACYPTSPADTADSPVSGGDTCTVLTSGTWTMTGAAWNMADNPMDGELTFDTESCAFTLDGWSMQMDDLPNAGVVDGTSVKLSGANSAWATCTGEAASEGQVEGTCSDDGDGFLMVVK